MLKHSAILVTEKETISYIVDIHILQLILHVYVFLLKVTQSIVYCQLMAIIKMHWIKKDVIFNKFGDLIL